MQPNKNKPDHPWNKSYKKAKFVRKKLTHKEADKYAKLVANEVEYRESKYGDEEGR